jgi:uncharacterized protein (TIGR02118 family)
VLTLSIASTAAVQADAWGQGLGPKVSEARMTAVKLIAIYERPDDAGAFFRHYEEVHAPLVKKIPGLQSFVLNTVTESLLGEEPAYVLIAEMTFANRASFDAAMESPENQAAAQDLMSFAKGKVRMMVADVANA